MHRSLICKAMLCAAYQASSIVNEHAHRIRDTHVRLTHLYIQTSTRSVSSHHHPAQHWFELYVDWYYFVHNRIETDRANAKQRDNATNAKKNVLNVYRFISIHAYTKKKFAFVYRWNGVKRSKWRVARKREPKPRPERWSLCVLFLGSASIATMYVHTLRECWQRQAILFLIRIQTFGMRIFLMSFYLASVYNYLNNLVVFTYGSALLFIRFLLSTHSRS